MLNNRYKYGRLTLNIAKNHPIIFPSEEGVRLEKWLIILSKDLYYKFYRIIDII